MAAVLVGVWTMLLFFIIFIFDTIVIGAALPTMHAMITATWVTFRISISGARFLSSRYYCGSSKAPC